MTSEPPNGLPISTLAHPTSQSLARHARLCLAQHFDNKQFSLRPIAELSLGTQSPISRTYYEPT